MISEKDFVINTFKSNFSEFKDRRVVLYGIGFNTRLILDECNDFNIVGLMDGTKAGETIYGKKVLTYEEVIEQKVDAIIVIARSNSAKIIYKRIRDFCAQNSIPLYDINKNNLFDLFDRSSVQNENEPYFQLNELELKKQIDLHEVISFDVFDTLVMRKVLYPQDVFDLVENKAANAGLTITNFKQHRAEAERELLLETNPTIHEIYNHLKLQTGIPEWEKEKLLQLELSTEKQVLIKREKMVEMLRYAISTRKKVYLISDMYLPKQILEEILLGLGIHGYQDLFVSCEYRTPKCNGLFSIFKQMVVGSSYLHIGDNYDADGIFAKMNRMDTFIIKSAVDMLEISSYSEIFNHLRSVNDRSLVGLYIANVFNNPFALYQSTGRPEIRNTQDVGFLFVAPIITNYMVWLLKAVREKEYDSILFAARDGYLIQKLYDKAVEYLGLENMPRSIYFLTSRMICAASSMKTEEDIIFVSSLPFAYSPEKLLEIRFGLKSNDIKPYNQELYTDVSTYALLHKEEIIEKSKETRDRYLEYIKRVGLKEGSKAAFFDFVSTGTCQMYLTDLLPCELSGLYFLHYLSDSTRKNQLSIRALFENGFTYQVQSYTFENYNFLETVVTSLDPSLSTFDESINPVFRPETRSEKELQYVADMHNAIYAYFEDYIKNLFNNNEEINPMCSEYLFSFMDRKYTNINCDALKNLILLDDFGVGKIEVVC
ncbi:hypothetical protein [Brevibacillus centrosporus]|uniref:hypothetical protein n=1 Tax=Brevibacillus centrosporus TaxID=54910 RepID=UPI002E219302|nr:hypothetical protein [Brevibacillus centrosporus]